MSEGTTKWTNTDVGPRKIKPIAELIKNIRWAAKNELELRNHLEGDEVVDEYSSFVTVQLVGGPINAEVIAKHDEVFNKYNGVISLANFDALKTDLEAVLKYAKDNPMIKDVRKTKEELIEQRDLIAARNDADKKRQEDFDSRAVTIPKDAMPILLEKTFDDSDGMTDYYRPHASVGEALLLGYTLTTKQTEKIARKATQLIPSIKELEWEWNTEKWSGGHGNYLMSTTSPESQEVDKYGRGKMMMPLRYEITFGYGQKFIPHPEYVGDIDKLSVGSNAVSDTKEPLEINGARIAENDDKDGIEIYFPGKPAQSILDKLHLNGWRWSRFNKCWYHKRTASARQFAEQLLAS